jgi:hypothetical protein
MAVCKSHESSQYQPEEPRLDEPRLKSNNQFHPEYIYPYEYIVSGFNCSVGMPEFMGAKSIASL